MNIENLPGSIVRLAYPVVSFPLVFYGVAAVNMSGPVVTYALSIYPEKPLFPILRVVRR
jgi:hypothetical protein